jgi:4-hydroxybenzoate polyprenyltransferase
MRALDIVFFCRPLLLIPVWTVFLLLYDIEYSQSSFPVSQLINLTMISGLTAAGYVINQIYDRRSDSINAKLGFFEPPVSIKVGFGWALYGALILVAAVFAFKHVELAAPYSASALAGVLYSAPLFRGKDRPFAGLALNAIPYSVILWWALAAEPGSVFGVFTQMEAMSALALSSLALALGGIYLITTIPDVEGDRETGKQTISALYGPRTALVAAAGLLFGALVFALFANSAPLYITAALAMSLAAFAIFTSNPGHVLLAAKVPILALSAFVSYQHPLYGVFLLALLALTRVYYRKRFGIVYPKLG